MQPTAREHLSALRLMPHVRPTGDSRMESPHQLKNLERVWFGLNATMILSSLAVHWTNALFGYEVVMFAGAAIFALPGLVSGRVLPDVVTLPDVWLGSSVALGWIGTLTYVGVVGGAGIRTLVLRAVVSTLLLGVAATGFGAFVIQQGSPEDLSRGFWLLCAGLSSSAALEATVFWNGRLTSR